MPVWDILVGDSPVAQRAGLGLGAFLSYMNIICFCERYIALTIIQYFRKKNFLSFDQGVKFKMVHNMYIPKDWQSCINTKIIQLF